jgi:hypothetical protein
MGGCSKAESGKPKAEIHTWACGPGDDFSFPLSAFASPASAWN